MRDKIIKYISILTICVGICSCGGGSVTSGFNTSCMPFHVAGSVNGIGGYAEDIDGNMLFTVNKEIRKMDRRNCTVSTVNSYIDLVNDLEDIAYDKKNKTIYVSSFDSIHAVNPDTGIMKRVAFVDDGALGIVVAPENFGQYSNHLIVTTFWGNVYAIDQSKALPIPALIVDTGELLTTDLVFSSDGTLYVANAYATIFKISHDGKITEFITGDSSFDGLAIDYAGNRLFVADPGVDKLKQITIPGGIVTEIGDADFDDGFSLSPIYFDGVNTVIVGVGETEHTITAFKL